MVPVTGCGERGRSEESGEGAWRLWTTKEWAVTKVNTIRSRNAFGSGQPSRVGETRIGGEATSIRTHRTARDGGDGTLLRIEQKPGRSILPDS